MLVGAAGGQGWLWAGSPSQEGMLAVAARPQCQLGTLTPWGHSAPGSLQRRARSCGPVPVLVSPVLPALTPGLGSPAQHGQEGSAPTFPWI